MEKNDKANNPADKNDIIKKALLLETQERTAFLNDITDAKLREQVAFIINDDEELTSFALHTAAADVALNSIQFNDLKPGQSINHITIKSLVGKGGMGNVYLAFDEKLKRNVAIKTIRPEFLSNPETQQRFMQEAQILSQINHPSICQIYDYIESDSGNLLVLEWIEGENLSQKKLNHQQPIDVLLSLASALQTAHEKGIIHRDLKPDNIMLTHDGQIKVLDFGIAQSVSALSQDKSPIGTLRYMSPEQAKGSTTGLYSDIYAFGLIMSELLSDQDCYKYHDTASLLDEVVAAKVNIPKDINKTLRHIIRQCVQKAPRNRPKAADLVKQLTQRQSKPNRLLGFMSALLGLSLLLGYYFWQKYQSNITFAAFEVKIDLLHDSLVKLETLPAHNTTTKQKQITSGFERLKKNIQDNNKLNDTEKLHLLGKLEYHNRNYPAAIELLDAGFQKQPKNQKMAFLYVQALSQNYFLDLSQNISDSASESYEKSPLFTATTQLKQTLNNINQYHLFDNHAALPLLQATEALINNNYNDAVKAIVTPTTQSDGDYSNLYLAGTIKSQ